MSKWESIVFVALLLGFFGFFSIFIIVDSSVEKAEIQLKIAQIQQDPNYIKQ